jgi:hypothetical protein
LFSTFAAELESTLEEDAFASSFASLRAKILERLGKVEIFKTLKKHQIGKLVDEMVDAPFEKGEFVFEQVCRRQ